MKIIFVYLIFAFLFLGCSVKYDDPVISDFRKTIDLELESCSINSDDLGELLDLVSFDSILIVNEVFREKIFKYFDLNSGTLVSNFINQGKGPNELIFPSLLTALNDSIFSTYDVHTKRNINFNIFTIKDGIYKVDDVDKMCSMEQITFQVYPLGNGRFICSGIFDEGKYCLYNTVLEKFSVSVDFPIDAKHESENNSVKSMAHQGEIAIKPDNKKFVFACRNGYFDICSISQEKPELEHRKIYYLSEYKVIANNVIAHSAKSNYAFHSVETTDKYFYLVYSGRSQAEYGREYVAGNNILVYDWEGNPIVHFRTNRHLHRMTLDKKNLKVYAYSMNPITGEPEIVACKLPKH